MLELKQRAQENPSWENIVPVFQQVFRDGDETGQIASDLFWAQSLMRIGMPAELIMKVWDQKDDIKRQANTLGSDSNIT